MEYHASTLDILRLKTNLQETQKSSQETIIDDSIQEVQEQPFNPFGKSLLTLLESDPSKTQPGVPHAMVEWITTLRQSEMAEAWMARPDAANRRVVSRIQDDVNRLGVQVLKEYASPSMAASLGYTFFCWVQQIPGGLIGKQEKIPISKEAPSHRPNDISLTNSLTAIGDPYRLPLKYLFTYLSEIRVAAGPRSYLLSYTANRARLYKCVARGEYQSADQLDLMSRWDFMVANSHTIFDDDEMEITTAEPSVADIVRDVIKIESIDVQTSQSLLAPPHPATDEIPDDKISVNKSNQQKHPLSLAASILKRTITKLKSKIKTFVKKLLRPGHRVRTV